MSFERINGAAMEYEAAVPAIQTVNATIDGAAANHAAIDMERDALVARALEADAKDAPKLAKAAEALGYPDGSRQRTQMIVSDPNRRDLLRLKNQAHTTALNFRAMAPEDFAHAAALRQAIADMLR